MSFLTVRQLAAELLALDDQDMHVTVPMLVAGDGDSIFAQGDVQGVDTNGDTAVLFVMDGRIADGES